MRAWSVCMFWLVAFCVVTKLLCVGLCDYPRQNTRATDLLDLLIEGGFLAWGLLVLW
ncbi:MAG: hypothetical protein ACYTEQ_00990 [Planctomycetota bacterium]|jgi:hypothetical protein